MHLKSKLNTPTVSFFSVDVVVQLCVQLATISCDIIKKKIFLNLCESLLTLTAVLGCFLLFAWGTRLLEKRDGCGLQGAASAAVLCDGAELPLLAQSGTPYDVADTWLNITATCRWTQRIMYAMKHVIEW